MIGTRFLSMTEQGLAQMREAFAYVMSSFILKFYQFKNFIRVS